jgi:CDP-4-dehydro-6-deoxyglucose reductase
LSDHPLLSLARAAQLLGVTRAALQKRIRDGELSTFDGQVAVDELQRVFPDLRVEDSGAFEKVTAIKETAFGRRILERALPSQELLAQRIFNQSEELAALKRHLQQYHALLADAIARLESAPAGVLRDALLGHLRDGLGGILADERDDTLETMQNMLKVVSAQVTVRPSGREFLVEGNDTLLQAGLKAGLRLSYGCGSGSCGLCKTRVVSGEVRQVAPADYCLSEAERSSGMVLSCVCSPVSDVVIETLEASGPGDIPMQEIVASVRTLQPLADHTLLLHLQTPRSKRLRFLAGQSVTLGLATANGDLSATWPIASCPCDDRNLHFHVGRDEDDALARHLFAGRVKAGDSINLRGPLGSFSLAGTSNRPFVFIAADLGFAPVKSLIEHAMAVDENDRFGLIWVATRPDGHYLDRICRMWEQAFDDFIYRPIAVEAGERCGHEAMAAAREIPFLADADVYVAGPEEFVAAVAAALSHDGIAAARLRSFSL